MLQIVFAGWGVPLATTPLDLWCTVIQCKSEEFLDFYLHFSCVCTWTKSYIWELWSWCVDLRLYVIFIYYISLLFKSKKNLILSMPKSSYHFFKNNFSILCIEGHIIEMHCCIMLLKLSHCSTKMHISCRSCKIFILFVGAWGTWWLVSEVEVFAVKLMIFFSVKQFFIILALYCRKLTFLSHCSG